MRMMISAFGDLNFSSLLCYQDDLLVFAPSEEEALKRLGMVFSRLRANTGHAAFLVPWRPTVTPATRPCHQRSLTMSTGNVRILDAILFRVTKDP